VRDIETEAIKVDVSNIIKASIMDGIRKKMSEELDAYIKLMNLVLEHPFTTEFPIANGRRNSSEEFVFAITPSRYRKLEQFRGNYNFKYSGGEYECNIVHLTRNQVRLRIYLNRKK
jgi:hypothetical protein